MNDILIILAVIWALWLALAVAYWYELRKYRVWVAKLTERLQTRERRKEKQKQTKLDKSTTRA